MKFSDWEEPYWESEEYKQAQLELDVYNDPARLVMEYRESETLKDQQIAELKKALELACDYIISEAGDELLEICKDIYDNKEYLKAKQKCFINKAREVLKGE